MSLQNKQKHHFFSKDPAVQQTQLLTPEHLVFDLVIDDSTYAKGTLRRRKEAARFLNSCISITLDQALKAWSPLFDEIVGDTGHTGIAEERSIRTQPGFFSCQLIAAKHFLVKTVSHIRRKKPQQQHAALSAKVERVR